MNKLILEIRFLTRGGVRSWKNLPNRLAQARNLHCFKTDLEKIMEGSILQESEIKNPDTEHLFLPPGFLYKVQRTGQQQFCVSVYHFQELRRNFLPMATFSQFFTWLLVFFYFLIYIQNV